MHLDASDVEALGAQVILANTYHLMMRPGADVVETLGGIHGMADWGGHVLTDSGGYQIFSLGPELSDEGATFKSTYDGSTHLLTPEGAVDVQAKLGADIQMVLDVCPSSIADLSVVGHMLGAAPLCVCTLCLALASLTLEPACFVLANAVTNFCATAADRDVFLHARAASALAALAALPIIALLLLGLSRLRLRGRRSRRNGGPPGPWFVPPPSTRMRRRLRRARSLGGAS